MQRVSYSPKLAAWAGMSDETYIEEFGADSEGMLVALETAPMDSGTPGIKTFKAEFLEQTGQQANSLNSLGWSNAELVVEALKRSEGLSRACLVEALESMENVETGIVPPVTWGPEDHQGVQAVGIGRITGGRLEVLTEPTELS
jgi:ABC-type branched-subunit amino acid transport system substrate-binding protein